ncbi:MAG: hypothetical protein PUB22_04415 [Clostridiales bacterium]|nr:hypothetical protein [Clostridiales bacterium]
MSGYTFSGGLTLEASMVMPLFLFAVYLFWLLFSMMAVHTRLQFAMEQVAGQMAQQSYLYQQWGNGNNTSSRQWDGIQHDLSLDGVMSDIVWKTYVKDQVVKEAGKDFLENSALKSGVNGISMAASTWDMEGDLVLYADYSIKLPGLLGTVWKIPIRQTCIHHCWTGNQSKESGSGDAGEMVYITATGSVYHRDISCYHLKLTIRSVSAGAVGGQRNQSGGKYYPCERCAVAVSAVDVVYITKEGNRYHTTKECAGLKRTVTSIPLSEAGGKRPCSNCGGTH